MANKKKKSQHSSQATKLNIVRMSLFGDHFYDHIKKKIEEEEKKAWLEEGPISHIGSTSGHGGKPDPVGLTGPVDEPMEDP